MSFLSLLHSFSSDNKHDSWIFIIITNRLYAISMNYFYKCTYHHGWFCFKKILFGQKVLKKDCHSPICIILEHIRRNSKKSAIIMKIRIRFVTKRIKSTFLKNHFLRLELNIYSNNLPYFSIFRPFCSTTTKGNLGVGVLCTIWQWWPQDYTILSSFYCTLIHILYQNGK